MDVLGEGRVGGALLVRMGRGGCAFLVRMGWGSPLGKDGLGWVCPPDEDVLGWQGIEFGRFDALLVIQWRVMARPWAADEFLRECMHEFIEKKDSITKIITFKPYFREMYNKNRSRCFEDIAVSKRIKDLAYAPQRYHSEARSLMRMIITWDAVLTTAVQVPLVRGATSPEGASMLQTIGKCTDEMALQLGMLGDMALECSQFVSHCDVDELDEGGFMSDVGDFNAVLARLFLQGMCVQIPGLTTVMMNALSRPRTFIISGRPKTFGSAGGVDPEMVTRCLRRMAAATVLAEVVIHAEFPEWDLLAAFNIFDVSVGRRGPATVTTDGKVIEASVRRLALALGLDTKDK